MKEKTAANPENKLDNAIQTVNLSQKQDNDFSSPGSAPFGSTLFWQRNLGNEAIQRMLETRAVQAKLTLGQPNDKYEQEADRVADQIMSMPEPKGSLVNGHWSLGKREKESSLVNGHSSLVQRKSKCPECEEEPDEPIQTKSIAQQITPLIQRQKEPEAEEEEVEPIQAKQSSNQTPYITPVLQSQIQSMKGGGQPLPKAVRNYFEPRFGRDFSQVRIHYDSRAIQTAHSINSRAFTVGSDIVFGNGEYSSMTNRGKCLLAHELTHVVQQGGAGDLGQRKSSEIRHHVPDGDNRLIQRVEHGTYISRHGGQDFLDAAYNFYISWGYPNVRRVDDMNDIVANLNRVAGNTIDRFRIVAHANQGGIELGLTRGFSPEWIGPNTTHYTSAEKFREYLSDRPMDNEADCLDRFLSLLRDNQTTNPLLTTLGVDQGVPQAGSPINLFLKALWDTHFLGNLRLNTGGVPKIPNLSQLNQYNRLRVNTYKNYIINETPRDRRQDVRGAINKLIRQTHIVLRQVDFEVTQDYVENLSDFFTNEVNGRRVMKRDLDTAIREGADGSFVTDLMRLKRKMTTSSHIEIRGCNIGINTAFLDDLRTFFARPYQPAVPAQGNQPARSEVVEALPIVSAPDIFQSYSAINSYAYGEKPQSQQQMAEDWRNPDKGIETAYHRSYRLRNLEMLQVVNDSTLAALCTRYQLDKNLLRQLNPHLDPTNLAPGDVVWLKAVPILYGQSSGLEDFCETHLGNRYLWPTIWSYNPEIRDPKTLKPDQPIWFLSPELRRQAGEGAPVRSLEDFRTNLNFQDYESYLRGGGPVVSSLGTSHHPTIYMDRRHMKDAATKWLAGQDFDPKGRTAAQLARVYRANFGNRMQNIYVQFLSRTYPNVVDPIFPEDMRYRGHIITRP